MKKIILILFFALGLLFSDNKHETRSKTSIKPIPETDLISYYIGIGLARGDYTGCIHEGCKYQDVTFGMMMRAGIEWDQYLGIEARGISTFWKADPLGGQKLQFIGVLAKPMYPIKEEFNLYGLLGYGHTKTKTGGNGNLQTVNKRGFSAGIGLEYSLFSKETRKTTQEKEWEIFVDYQRLLADSNAPVMDTVSIGIIYNF